MNRIAETLSSQFEIQSFSRFMSKNNLIVAAALAALAGIVFLFAKLYVHYKKIKGEHFLTEALNLSRRNEMERAEQAFRQAIRYENDPEGLKQSWIENLSALEKWHQIEKSVEEWLDAGAVLNTRMHLAFLNALMKQGKYQKAYTSNQLYPVVEIPLELKARLLEGFSNCVIQENKWEEAEGLLSELIQLRPDHQGHEIPLNYLKSLLQQGKLQNAERFLEQKLATQPNVFLSIPAYGSLYGFLLLEKGEGERACEIFAQTLERHPEHHRLLIYQAEAQKLAGKPLDERLAPLENYFIRIRHEVYQAQEVHLTMERAAIISQLAEAARERHPDVGGLIYLLDRFYQNEARDETEEIFQSGSLGYVWASLAHRKNGDLNAARLEILKAYEQNPEHIYVKRELRLIELEIELKAFRTAMQERNFEEAERLEKKYPETLEAAQHYFLTRQWYKLYKLIEKLQLKAPNSKIMNLDLEELKALCLPLVGQQLLDEIMNNPPAEDVGN